MNSRVTLFLVILLSCVGSSFSGGSKKCSDAIEDNGLITEKVGNKEKRPHTADRQKERVTKREIKAARYAKDMRNNAFAAGVSITGPMDWGNCNK